MKKLLALLILSPLIVSEEIEYPIELTCINGTSVIHLSLTENQNYSFSDGNWAMIIYNAFVREKKWNKKIKVRVANQNSNFTYINGKDILLEINNRTLGSYSGGGRTPYGGAGQCYKGFKEFEKQI